MTTSSTYETSEAAVSDRLRASLVDQRAYNVRYRQKQLHLLHAALREHASIIPDLIANDSGHNHDDSELEFCATLVTINTLYEQLDFDRTLEQEYAVSRNQSNSSCRIPHGIVLIRPGTHNIFFSILSAVAAALAAGNCIILEIDTNATSLGSFLKSEFSVLDQETFAILPSVTNPDLLSQCFIVDQRVSVGFKSTASHLGSDTPQFVSAIVDRTAHVPRAAQEICAALYLFNAEALYAPDIVHVNEWVLESFVEACITELGGDADAISIARKLLPAAGASFRLGAHTTIFEIDGFKIVYDGSGMRSRKFPNRTLYINSVTGLADAITKTSNSRPFLASYFFGDLKTCKFLHQYIDSRTSFVNEIPLSVLVGPPRPATALSPGDINLPYNLEFMSKPKPAFVTPKSTPASFLANSRKYGPKAQRDHDSTQRVQIRQAAAMPLNAINQHSGSGSGFFDQGILTGLIAFVLPSVIFMSWAGFKATKFAWDHSQALGRFM
ncbi:hypothetical protein EDB81DRAFT_883923 [Dactylonectria macrodidyma]|uniref:Aldehyde dehydrogenase domain-containing protein n=1 Tax=Dactylonectria macrodidyma TaxID=307937 RepID=A0A9P9EWA2_9HYPO|nr:hypothetical protein EDB81DRAFT_883923 [Dactylonectria macrodidyma]